jgi:RNA polymerase sigma factor (sigma-70 family)
MFSLLTAGEQEVMALTLWEDLRPQEIAQALHLSENAVSLRLFKARAKIKKALENEKD